MPIDTRKAVDRLRDYVRARAMLFRTGGWLHKKTACSVGGTE
jgi:hypothetical protein